MTPCLRTHQPKKSEELDKNIVAGHCLAGAALWITAVKFSGLAAAAANGTGFALCCFTTLCGLVCRDQEEKVIREALNRSCLTVSHIDVPRPVSPPPIQQAMQR